MKMKLKRFSSGQAGISLFELLVVVAIVALVGAGSAALIGQVVRRDNLASSSTAAIAQVESVGHWITRDALRAQAVTPDPVTGFPLLLAWQTKEGNVHEITYSLSGNSLLRNVSVDGIPSAQTSVAQNINTDAAETYCSYAEGVLNLEVTVTSGLASESRGYQIKTRVDQPSS